MVESVADLTLDDKESPAPVAEKNKEVGENGAYHDSSKVNGEDTSGVAGAEVGEEKTEKTEQAEKIQEPEKTNTTEKIEATSSNNKVNENPEPITENNTTTEPPKEVPAKQEPPSPPPKEDPPKEDPPKEDPPKEDPPKEEPTKEEPPKEEPPKENHKHHKENHKDHKENHKDHKDHKDQENHKDHKDQENHKDHKDQENHKDHKDQENHKDHKENHKEKNKENKNSKENDNKSEANKNGSGSNNSEHNTENGEKKKKKWSLFGWIKKEVIYKRDKPSDDSKDKDPEHSNTDKGQDNKDNKEGTEQNEESKEKKLIIVSCVDDFPEDCQKLIKQCGIPREKLEAHFKILMNVLHFRTGKIFKTPETVSDPPRPALPKSTRLKRGEELVTDAGEFKKLYKDMEELGKGGFGSVFQARSTKDKKKLVAIKRMVHKTKKHKAANFHEAAILSYCNHPNIVKYLTCHEIKEELWVVMELMEGGTFEDAAKAWHFSEANIAYIARELLKGIAYLHANQLAHRDLKSANIMMSVRGEVKIIDLGLCADMSVGFPTHMVGSPFWMPPEMIQCKPHSYAVDIWSFAISLLEIANQRPPMIESAVKAMFTVGTEGVSDMFLDEKKWSSEFKDFLGLCLKVDPEERATAADLLNHPFIKKADSRANMENILRRIFLSNSLLNSGF